MNQYFSYCPDDGFSYHSTSEEAHAAFIKNTDDNFQFYIDGPVSDDDISMVTGCCWGLMKGFCELEQRPATEEDKGKVGDDVDSYIYGWHESKIIGTDHGEPIFWATPPEYKHIAP